MHVRGLGRPSRMSISAVVTRADGRVEDLGEIAYWHKNPLRRVLHTLGRWVKKGLRHG